MKIIKIIFKILFITISVVIIMVLILGTILFININQKDGEVLTSGETRKYLLHIPDNYDPSIPTPLVISIHGFAEWPAHQMNLSHWNELANQENFIVVYPRGSSFPLRWRTNGLGDSLLDVQYISDLIEKLQEEYNIDPQRIYANGLSNGAGMSFQLACKLSDRIAAFGGVAGAYTLSWENCQTERPVPAIIFHGTADPIVPFTGGPSRDFNVPFPDISEWVEQMAQKNGCESIPKIIPTREKISGYHFTNCDQNADVDYYIVDGGGHSWPGGDPLPEWIVGITSDNINATQTMWKFFIAHPKGD